MSTQITLQESINTELMEFFNISNFKTQLEDLIEEYLGHNIEYYIQIGNTSVIFAINNTNIITKIDPNSLKHLRYNTYYLDINAIFSINTNLSEYNIYPITFPYTFRLKLNMDKFLKNRNDTVNIGDCGISVELLEKMNYFHEESLPIMSSFIENIKEFIVNRNNTVDVSDFNYETFITYINNFIDISKYTLNVNDKFIELYNFNEFDFTDTNKMIMSLNKNEPKEMTTSIDDETTTQEKEKIQLDSNPEEEEEKDLNKTIQDLIDSGKIKIKNTNDTSSNTKIEDLTKEEWMKLLNRDTGKFSREFEDYNSLNKEEWLEVLTKIPNKIIKYIELDVDYYELEYIWNRIPTTKMFYF